MKIHYNLIIKDRGNTEVNLISPVLYNHIQSEESGTKKKSGSERLVWNALFQLPWSI